MLFSYVIVCPLNVSIFPLTEFISLLKPEEITARQDEGQILSGVINDNREHLINGGIYDSENGLLTLNTNNSANTIYINLTSNYGIYPNRN